ncbi:KilA-N domain-containing protein [Phocaeicola vulgatus]|nr:KilA-N domain-containing protein [Phocaeicola vulgatus]
MNIRYPLRGSLSNTYAKIKVQNTEVTVITYNDKDYISLTDMVRNMENGPALIEKWLRNKNTVEFLGIWEEMYNPDFNSPEFEGIKNEAGLNRFILSVKQWVEKTNSKGIIAKAGRYGGTYAHKDIAFEFATWVSPQFKLYLLKEFQRLKEEEQAQLGWSAKRELSKINYRIHTDAIRQNLIPVEVTPAQAGIIYAEEADVLNVAMFGMTARMWREQNPGLKGNIRDYASINELICLSNMENLNAVFIDQGIPQGERLVRLNRIAIQQMRVLEDDGGRKLLE